MKICRMTASGICCLMLMAGPGRAQMGLGMRGGPTPHGFFNPIVGQGSEYDITSTDGRKNTMELAIVGKESVGDKDGYWMEITSSGIVMKSLTVAGDSSVTTRVIIQIAGRPPMEMPSQMIHMNGQGAGASQSATTDIRATSEDVGSESVTVPAGTFTCEHYRAKDGSGDTWVSPKVSPLGVVKHQGKDSSMVLTKVITDAKDKIIGNPVPFNPMMFQQPPQE
jgi:hypothetical protein